ncbi:MAG: FlgD immunoglobulin-like domain containing protein, partial [Victivallales bacterium]
MSKKILVLFLCLSVMALSVLAGGGRNRVMGGGLEIQPVSVPVKVDGDLEEWDESRAQLLTLTIELNASKMEVPMSQYSAKIAFMHDKDALYAGVWWSDPTPLGPETSPGCTPSGDGLILGVPLDGMRHLAFWREPGGTAVRAVMSVGDAPLSGGRELKGVRQGYKVVGKNAYMQEIAIPWSELGGRLAPGKEARIGVELCFGGLDPAAGYKAWQSNSAARIMLPDNRWGGRMCWGFMDGICSPDLPSSGFDPANGAEVKCMPAGSVSGANPPVMFNGNEQTRTTKMIAVPAGKITVDGDFSAGEWDDSSGTTISSESTLLPSRYATKVHFAYAADGLYVGLRWLTGGAHLNINNPAVSAHGYDGGDAVQIRLGTDRVTHIDAWYYDEGKKPFIVLDYGASFNDGKEMDAIAKGARMSIRTLPEGAHSTGSGQGYTQELFFPWPMITKSGQALKEGDSFRVIFDLFYSGLEGNRIPFIINTKLAQSTGVAALPFTAPRDGFYSALISNSNGEVIRRLLTHAKLRNGQEIEWDGLDNDGKPAAPGNYSFRGLHHTGVGLKYLTTYNNPGTPPWQNDDGTGDWGGDESSPNTVAADDQGVYLGWPGAEMSDGIIGCDFNGKKRWRFFSTPSPTSVSSCLLASDGQYLYFAHEVNATSSSQEGKDVSYFKTIITCLDRATGRRTEFSLAKSFPEISRHSVPKDKVSWWWDIFKDKSFSLDTCGIQDEYHITGQCYGADLAGLAARDGKLYFSLRATNEIVVYESGKFDTALKDAADFSTAVEASSRWKIDKPGGLAFSPDGQLFAISGRSVMRVDLVNGTAAEVVKAGLSAPVGLAIDKEGVLYVSEWGDAQCVKVFSKEGKPLRMIGLPGGRPWIGKYDPKGMLMPRGIAVDKEGKLWVAENDSQPRRVSVWNAKTGELVREFIGGSHYGGIGGGQVDPRNSSHALSAWGTLFEINLEKGGYRPLANLWRRTSLNACFSPLTSLSGKKFHDIDGRRFTVNSVGYCMVLSELKNDMTALPRAAVGGVPNRNDCALINKGLRIRNLIMPIYPEFMYGHPDENFAWTDLNGDGMAQSDEMQWRKKSPELPILANKTWDNGALDGKHNLVMGTMSDEAVIRLVFQGLTESG